MKSDYTNEMLLHTIKSFKESFLLALKLEWSFRAPLGKRYTFKWRKQCSNCEGFGHSKYKYLLMNLHSYIVYIDDIDGLRAVEGVHVLFEGTSDVDTLIESTWCFISRFWD